MGHHSCCNKQKVKRGLWSPEEDEKLIAYISSYGHGCWSSVPKLAGICFWFNLNLSPSSTSYLTIPNTSFHDSILNTSLNPNPEFYPHVLDDNHDPFYVPATPSSSLALQAGFDKLEKMMIPNYGFDENSFNLIPAVPSVPLAHEMNYFSSSFHDHDYNKNQNQKQSYDHDYSADTSPAFGYLQPQILDHLHLLDQDHSKQDATNFMARPKMKNVHSSSTYSHDANALSGLMVPKLCHEETITNMPPLSSYSHDFRIPSATSQMEYPNIDTSAILLSSLPSSSAASSSPSPSSFVVNLSGLATNSWPGTLDKT
ncbi:hypothetical protein AG4045_002248 [Apium graveolens]|uniref:Uncharacterized protein n=1 Tax=Apium graveolens TaxID=4045 RepID=A0A6L5B971_APIGR|nr:hypothetical protein AG4045_002248 [Apium graveolens]